MELDIITVAPNYGIVESTVFYDDTDIEKQYKRERSKPMPSRNHAKIQRRLCDALHSKYGREYDVLPEFEMELLNKRSVPDVSVYPFKPSNWEQDEMRAKEPPILAIEILSPKQILGDVLTKIRNNYFPSGVLSTWVVLPALKTITLMLPNGEIQNFNEGILKDKATGFEVNLTDIFQ